VQPEQTILLVTGTFLLSASISSSYNFSAKLVLGDFCNAVEFFSGHQQTPGRLKLTERLGPAEPHIYGLKEAGHSHTCCNCYGMLLVPYDASQLTAAYRQLPDNERKLKEQRTLL